MRAKNALTEEQVQSRRVVEIRKQAIRSYHSSCRDLQVNRFLDEFLTARIGTDILSSQYLAITRRVLPASWKGSTNMSEPLL